MIIKKLTSLSSYWYLALLLLLAFTLRIYDLTNLPAGIHGDEASIGYNAYSLLKTGYDQNGTFLPLAIDQFGDFRPPGYHYIDIPFVALLGLNELSTRLPAALFGSATILVFYFFLLEIFKNKNISLIGSGLLAISPWHIVISRATSEGIIAAFFILFGVLFMFKANQKKEKSSFFVVSFLSFLLSFLFYHSARFFVPVFLIPFILLLFQKYKVSRKIILYVSILFISLIAILYLLFSVGKGEARPLTVSIFNFPMGTHDLEQQIGQDGNQNPYITRFFHNKVFYYGRIFLTNYFQHFDGDFLFVNNGLPVRYKVPWTGNLNLIDLPFLLFGFSVLLTEGIKNKKTFYLIPVLWLIVAAIPAGLTWEDIPNIQRSSLMLYGFLAITAFGINEFFQIPNKKVKPILLIVFLLFLTHNFFYFIHNYYYHARIYEPWHRSAAAKEVVFTVNELSKTYDTIRMTTQGNNNLVHHLFYNKFDPVLFKKMGSPREEENLRFGKVIFTGNYCPLEGDPEKYATHYKKGIIYIDMPQCKLPKNAEIIKTIRHPDGIPAYYVVKLNPIPS